MGEARCKICGETISYLPDKLGVLAEHFCYDHPNFDIGYFTILNIDDSKYEYVEDPKKHDYPEDHSKYEYADNTKKSEYPQETKKAADSKATSCSCTAREKILGCPKAKHDLPHCLLCDCDHHTLNYDCARNYKTTVESWSRGPNCIACPGCGCTDFPLIRRQRNKIAKSSIGAMCLLGCWPLCFLPFMLGGSNILNLYCRNCGRFLATYDRHFGEVKNEKFEILTVPKLCS